jgi:phenolic acid decarboxylase
VEGFICKIEGLGSICNWILNYRGLSLKSIKELDYRLDSGKVRGLIAKCQGKSITGRIIFLKKTLWTESTGPWTKGDDASPWSMLDRASYPFASF